MTHQTRRSACVADTSAHDPATGAITSSAVALAGQRIARASRLLIAAGAGMGVDSGLPDFRGDEGFWRAYPPYGGKHGFEAMANARWFRDDPALAWGFYGHRLHLYRDATPHPGFAILRRWSEALGPGRSFVITSNVDGQFQRAGFRPAHLHEVHGSIHHLQCIEACGVGIVSSAGLQVRYDPATFRAHAPLPQCPQCGCLLRPNVCMFGDPDWDDGREAEQQRLAHRWLRLADSSLVVVELGAGQHVPTIRMLGETLVRRVGAQLVRINPRETEVPPGQVGIALPAIGALKALDEVVAALRGAEQP